MQENNPYQAPSAQVITANTPSQGNFISGGQTVPVGNGVSWITKAWTVFTQSPIMWIISLVIVLVIMVVLNFIPFIGSLVGSTIWPVFLGGLMLGCRAQDEGRPLELGDLFSGFQAKAGPLLTVGALNCVAGIALMVLMGIALAVVLGATGALGAIMSGDNDAMAGLISKFGMGAVLVMLIVVALSIPIAMAFWFAPALVALHDVAPVAAIAMSFKACLRNFIPFILYGIVLFVMMIIGAIPLGLGLLVVIPVMVASIYTSYKDIFVAE